MNYAFQRHQRLLSETDFKPVFAKPQRSTLRYFTVLARRNQNTNAPARLGLAIAKKQLRLATARNHVKRQIRESFRLQQHALVGIDFVVMVRQAIQTADNAAMQRELQQHWRFLLRRLNK